MSTLPDSGACKIGIRLVLTVLLMFGLSQSAFADERGGGRASANGGFIESMVWLDTNQDAIRDKNETGVAGVSVSLLRCDGGFVEATFTDGRGTFNFNRVPAGCYRLRFGAMDGYRYCPANQGSAVWRDSDADPTTGLTPSFELDVNESLANLDAGLIALVAPEIGDRVWEDINANGVQDVGEPGLGDVSVALLDCAGNAVNDGAGNQRVTTTDSDGFFVFEGLATDCYSVQITAPAGYLFSEPDMTIEMFDSDADPLTGVAQAGPVGPAQGLFSIDAGVYRTSKIGDWIWNDVNFDHVQGQTEPGIAGAQVLLLDADGVPLGQSVQSDVDGYYEFASVKPGFYRLQFVLPEEYTSFAYNGVGDDELDSNPNSLGITPVFAVRSGGEHFDIDAAVRDSHFPFEVTAEKLTNGEDADTAPGPYIPVGDPVLWEYVLTNTGTETLFAVTAVDDQGVSVSCPQADLLAGETMTCTGNGIAQAGQYLNEVYACGRAFSPTGGAWCDKELSHYFGSAPGISLEKSTNGQDADNPTGPLIPAGGVVNWEYFVLNTGNVTLTNISVIDDQGVIVTCPSTTLDPGVSMSCTATGTAIVGQYSNLGTVTGTPPVGDPVIDDDPSHYFGVSDANIDIEKATNGFDADTPTGPIVMVGDTVNWTYVVTNTGGVTLNNIIVTDDQGVAVSCPGTTLAPGASFTCTASGIATAGQYANLGTVTGTPPTGDPVTDIDPSHYLGVTPSIDIEKATNGEDADTPTGPTVAVGSTVNWTYVVTNTGPITLIDIVVTDDQGVAVSCPATTLLPGASFTCTGTGIAQAGQYANIGSVTGQGVDPNGDPVGDPVDDLDPSHYLGVTPSIDIEKATNGEDADTPTGPTVLIGSTVNWTYVVTNTGGVTLNNIVVTDDQGVAVSCPGTTLAPGASFTCTGTGIAQAGQYANLGTVTGTPPTGDPVDDTDPSHYFGTDVSIDLEKSTNGEDADTPTGPTVAVGSVVTWTYTVTNTGNVTLFDLLVTDNQGVVVTCPTTSLAPGASIDCTGTGIAQEGQYSNLGTACANDGADIPTTACDDDPSHYLGVTPSIDIEKATNGEDADTPTGPTVLVGSTVNWTYLVTNTGPITLNDIVVTDDQGVAVSCPATTLLPGESFTCTGTGIAQAGQYANIGSVTGQGVDPNGDPVGDPVDDLDPSHYLGVTPSIDIEKATNGEDADTPTGPTVVVGSTVNWTYVVTNTGPITLNDIVVTDDQGVAVSCPATTLLPGASFTCTGTGIAQAGQYANIGSVTGQGVDPNGDPVGDPVNDLDPSHYLGVTPSIDIEKATNGVDADTPTGPTVLVGSTVNWTYVVTNTGPITLNDIVVTDDQGVAVSCPATTLLPGASFTCTGTGIAQAGQYANIGSVTGQGVDPNGDPIGDPVNDLDPSHYLGVTPSIDIEKATNGVDADTPTGPTVLVGSTVNWTYVVTNTGPITLNDIVVTDDQGVAVSCPATTLLPGASFTCTGTGIAQAGQYANIGSVTGQGVDPNGDPIGDPVNDLDPSHYLGVTPSIDIEKATNGEDADTPTGPTVLVGSTVNWTYVVTNTGPITLTDIVVTDDQGVAVSCPATTLLPGASFTCTGTGIAQAGQYANIGSVTGQGVDPNGDPVGDPVNDLDPSHYLGVTPSIDIEKATNGVDADTPTGPTVLVGSTVNWTYVVTNTGPITLNDIVVTDDQGVAVSCPATTLLPGASFTCTGTGIAQAGQYANIGSVTGQGVDPNGDPIGDPVNDLDPSHYLGVTPSIDIEKATNGVDADTPTGPTVLVGSTVNWTYVVTNTGPITLNDIVVTDDQGVAVSCPATTLLPGASFTCTGTGIAQAGQYANIGSVTGQGVDPNGDPIGDPVNDLDPSHYLGVTPSIDIEKATNGVDADTPTGPTVLVGSTVNWTYVVTNTGPITLNDIVVTDDQGVAVSCPATTLLPGASFTCTGTGIAQAGQYANIGSVTGQGVDPNGDPIGDPVNDLDPSHYLGVTPAIDIEKATNGEDADTPTGPTVLVGSTVNWTYVVTNTGPITLTDIVVTDDQGVAVSCPATTLLPGASFTCTGTGIAQAGQYANIGSVTGQGVDPNGDPIGDPVNDLDPSHYLGVTPSIDIEKATNGVDADTPTGPTVAVGSTVNWTYVVTNTGPITLNDIVVTDDQGVAVSCPATTLLPGASFTCTGTGIAQAGQYANIGSVTGQGVDPNGDPIGDPVNDLDPSHYLGVTPSIDIEKATNGVDADTPTGPTVLVGSTVNWTYVVTNTGPITLNDIVVTDDQGVAVSCPATTLLPGASFTCTGTGIAQAGQYANIGSVTGQGVDPNGDPIGDPVNDLDPSHYLGVTPAIDIEKATNGEDADTPTGPTVLVGSTVNWTYVVTNTGPITLTDIVVTDDQGVAVSCPATTLLPGASFTCTGTGIAQAGQYANIGSVTGQGVDPNGDPIGDPVNDLDPSHYLGVTPSIDIEKATNGVDADTPTGPTVAVGSTVNWTYVVTNTGPITLNDIVVTDDQGVAVSCPATTLLPGASFTCTGTGIAQAGQYANIGSVTGQGVDPNGDPIGDPVNDLDPSHYLGVTPSIDIEKATNGVDADTPTGPTVLVGSTVNWTYVVTNTGPITLNDIVVTDDQGVAVSCPATTLLPGASFTCTGTGIAQAGQYANIGSVTGQGVDPNGDPIGDPVNDLDPSHYLGVTPAIDIEKATNGEDADTPTGPTVAVGSTVNWTYVVTNTGPITLTDIVVTDDQGVAVSCPATTLLPGASFTCTGTGIAQAGQYANIGSVTGQGVDPNGDPIGDPVNDLDPSHYLGVTPSIDIEKATNGVDADTPTGPTVAVGSTVNWTYVVTNTGPITLNDIVVTDDQGVAVSCPATTLLPGASFTCTGTGIAQAGQYANIGSVTGQGVDPNGDPIGDPVNDLDPSHYLGVTPSIDIEKATNGEDADTPTGPSVIVGATINWTYVVTNTGPITLNDIVVTDDQGVAVSCPATTLLPGASFTCTGTGIAQAGQYANIGSVTGQGVDPNGDPVGDPVIDTDPSHYLGLELASLGDKVFKDLNADGQQDAGEPGVPGITVNLWTDDDGDGLPDTQIATTVTDANGNYGFPGLDPTLVYVVEFVNDPAMNMPFTTPNVGDDTTDSDAGPGGITGPITLTSGENNPTIDAGLVNLPASLGDRVFKDLNADGQQDAGEPGVPGITVNLWTDDDGDGTPDTQIATTVTDVNGNYGFPGLDPTLVYVVEFVNDPAMNMPFTTPNVGDDTTDSDAGPGGITGPITLTSGENNPTIDAGLVNLPASLGDRVFKDLNADGQQDAGEPGVPGITVNLWTDDDGDGLPDTQIATTVTDVNGNYGFPGLDPTLVYVVEFVNDPAMNMPFTTPNVGDDTTDSDAGPGGITGPITLTSGENNPTIDAGLVNLPASLGDRVFKDLNADGQQDAGEPGVPGITVNLWTDDDGDGLPDTLIATTVTDANGNYGFPGLDSTLVYVVEFVNDPAMNMPFTTPNVGDDTTDSDAGVGGITGPITLTSGENNPTIDAGLVNLPASLGDRVFKDLNADGQQDAGESGVPGITVNLWTDDDGDGTPDTLIATTVTDANGNYGFPGLDPTLVYVVEFVNDPAMNMPFTTPNVGDDTTDSDAGVGGITGPITLTSGENNPTIDAGLVNLPASLGDRVFKDLNADGQQDAGEPGVPGITVNLWTDDDGDGTPDTLIATTVTDANGNYGFTDLDPTLVYVVEFVNDPAMNMPFTAPNVGDDTTDSDAGAGGITGPITLTSGENNPTIDAGLVNLPASLGDRVFKDLNSDGQQDAGEPGVPGITVNLWTDDDGDGLPDTLIATTVTDANGNYGFPGLDPALVYVVEFVNDPAMNMPFTSPNVGDDTTDSDAGAGGITGPIVLASGENNPTIDAGLVNLPASLGDRVFKDLNADGQQDAGEPGVPGITVNLWTDDDGDGLPDTLIATTVTDANGNYGFPGLDSTLTYVVEFVNDPAMNMPFTSPNVGNDMTDSDAGAGGITGPIMLASGENNPTIDAGLVNLPASLGDKVFKDLNANGQQDAGEPGIPGITVHLWTDDDGDGTPDTLIVTTATDANGMYGFANLDPMMGYVVQFVNDPAMNMPFTTPNVGDDTTDSDAGAGGFSGLITLASGENNPTIDAGLVNLPASLGDKVFKDLNADGQQDAGEPGIPGITVNLWTDDDGNGTPDTQIATTTTDANGMYGFADLDPTLVYIVQFVNDPALNMPFTTPNVGDDATDSDAGAGGLSGSITLVSGEHNPTIDAGLVNLPASLGDFVWIDVNRDGIQDAGEPGVPGATVNLWTDDDGDGTPDTLIATTTTDANGMYIFEGLDNDTIYIVQFEGIPGKPFTVQGAGGDFNVDSNPDVVSGFAAPVTLLSGEYNPTIDAGVIMLGASIDIEKATNGEDADAPTGPVVGTGSTVNWTYVVTNTGELTLTNVAVSDDQGVAVTCPGDTLLPGASFTCTASGIAVAGQYANLGSVIGQPTDGGVPVGNPVSDIDPSHYYGANPDIQIVKYTNGDDANNPPGPSIEVGDTVSWVYVVTNTGNVTLFDLAVSDDQGVTVSCPVTSLAPGDTAVCSGIGMATPGQYVNVGSVCANDGAAVPTEVCDDDPSHYFGTQIAIDLEKSTNGVDADTPSGPAIMVGDTVTWTYTVTNTGNMTLFDLALADDQGVAIICPVNSLAPGASVDCTGTGVATLGQYANLGTACANDGATIPATVCDIDPSHYVGVILSIEVEKATNGEDADTPMGPSISIGDTVTWTYVVTNTGSATLFDLLVTDDQGVVVTCPVDMLAPGASTTCTGTGTAIEGQYANLGTACANNGAGVPTTVCDDDPSHYFGISCEVSIDATCLIPMPPATDYVCDSPIDTLVFIWDGATDVRIKAWKGSVGSTLLADIDNIAPGEEISVSGFAGSPNDVYFEVFDAGTNTKIGESNFHLSCSDDGMDGPEDCGMPQGNGKNDDSGLINDWLLEGIVDQGGTLDCTPPNITGSDSCEFQAFPASCDTISNVDTMTFVYTGGSCLDSQNDQGDKFVCAGTVDGAAPALVTLANGNTFTVNPGEAFTIPESGSGTEFSLSNAGGTMDLNVHTSCSAPLVTDDIYGATTLQLINNMGGGTDVIYGYKITNTGDTQLTNLSVFDSLFGPISGAPATLDPGEMATLFSTAFITTTTNSSVIVDATNGAGASCSAMDTVDVTILPPPPCDITGEGVLDINDSNIKWTLENVGLSSATVESITISWPEALNGDLIEVKFGGTKIYDLDTSGGTVTLGPGDWIDDPNVRVIDPGNVETLEIKFADSSGGQAVQSDYAITVNFEEGCSVTYVNTGLPFECNGPIDELSMIWDGAADPIQVKAWKGPVGSELLLDQSGINAGDVVTVSGYAGSPNDVFWEIFSGGSKIGESNFHMSCSDSNMNGADDCGKREGDGKSDDASFVNDWLLEGMVDSDGPFDCTP